MNAPTHIETGTMTSKGQILIPKAMRDAVGLVPGQPYKVAVNDGGQVVVTPLGFTQAEGEERMRRVRDAIAALAGKYATGQSTDDYMREVRGDREP
ncbi:MULTISPECIES: AbrB/MazE/SpoVT family DNA-binding domain-containing protein [unclassified Sphingomonas]|uniref:AbrB/MazE/SpoVT family DNA-binding domain-containing protein n=1 Tax=unclassified Sphingomonas TaxID=196159 RepID=UPI001E5002D1|nr:MULTISPECIES: AbrB/MazE/SpoVT family DNA-binding domain-containing protein [unclassified Sphingomonas]MCC2976426.1 AbrB/MazE/SpoVT family DNA-binding domain-containing protein [Sphingomonas sp. PL-96]MCG7349874.1 AbrB/MazE/SpoVT family DNA-binding domain-containing protein [Sphingomonas sp. ACRSK]